MSCRLKDGSPRKPSKKQLARAIERGRFFFRLNAGRDDLHGLVADSIVGPLLRAHEDLAAENELLKRDVQKLMQRKIKETP